MVLKDESDLLVAKRRQLAFLKFEWVLSVERDGAAGGRFQSAHHVKQRALATA